jgi:hypothetical protein
MIKLTATIDGKPVPFDQLGSALEMAIYRNVATQIKSRMEDVRCPIHGETLESIEFQRRDGDSLKYELKGCCQVLLDACRETMGGAA